MPKIRFKPPTSDELITPPNLYTDRKIEELKEYILDEMKKMIGIDYKNPIQKLPSPLHNELIDMGYEFTFLYPQIPVYTFAQLELHYLDKRDVYKVYFNGTNDNYPLIGWVKYSDQAKILKEIHRTSS